MAINVDNFLYSWPRILLASVVVMLLKAGILYGLARVFRANHNDAVRIALLLPQAGEFAFVLFASASAVRALWPSETAFVAGIVTVTMALTPFTVMLGRYFLKHEDEDELEEDFEGAGGNVLVVGFGRFGQILAQVLLAKNVNATILDASAERVRQAARFGFRIYFGDGTRRDVLRAAGAEQAAIICICVDKPDVANRIVDLVMHEFASAKCSCAPGIAATRWSFSPRVSTTSCARPTNRRSPSARRRFAASAFAADEVDDVLVDVRKRDADRLAVQLSGDDAAGVAATKPTEVTPEPLRPPARRRGTGRTERRGRRYAGRPPARAHGGRMSRQSRAWPRRTRWL